MATINIVWAILILLCIAFGVFANILRYKHLKRLKDPNYNLIVEQNLLCQNQKTYYERLQTYFNLIAEHNRLLHNYQMRYAKNYVNHIIDNWRCDRDKKIDVSPSSSPKIH